MYISSVSSEVSLSLVTARAAARNCSKVGQKLSLLLLRLHR